MKGKNNNSIQNLPKGLNIETILPGVRQKISTRHIKGKGEDIFISLIDPHYFQSIYGKNFVVGIRREHQIKHTGKERIKNETVLYTTTSTNQLRKLVRNTFFIQSDGAKEIVHPELDACNRIYVELKANKSILIVQWMINDEPQKKTTSTNQLSNFK